MINKIKFEADIPEYNGYAPTAVIVNNKDIDKLCLNNYVQNWFFDESNLSWSFQVTVESSTGVLQETFHYDMVVSKHKTLTFPT